METYITHLRTLTHKSIIGFGYEDIRDLRVGDLINSCRHAQLIKMYYLLGKISFTDEVLCELGITEELRIPKPGKSPELWNKYKDKIYQNIREINPTFEGMERKMRNKGKKYKKADEFAKSKKIFSKEALQRRNHGHKTR